MIYVKNISNWPDPGGQRWDMNQNYSLRLHKGKFPGKLKTTKAHEYVLKHSQSTSLLSTIKHIKLA